MADEDSDPVVASYDIFVKPSISEDRQVYVLQFPNRDAHMEYTKSNHARPSVMRLKENAGMVEMDVPLDAWHNYDRERGHRWGKSIQKSNSSKAGGSHGLPGGFGIGGATATARGRRTVDDEGNVDENALTKDYALAVERGEILTKQTLGGQFISDDITTPRYMVGVFKHDQLHLVPVDQVVQMRPQFHHIDARMEQERSSRARDTAIGTTPAQARAIHMTVKSKVDGEDSTMDNMGERITMAQAEKWKIHKWVDENEEEAWEFYHENLFVGAEDRIAGTDELKAAVPALNSALVNMEYMDTISAPNDFARLSRSKNEKKKKKSSKGKELSVVESGGSDYGDSEEEVVESIQE